MEERRFRLGGQTGKRFRPFSFSADMEQEGYSRPLERRISDFGADHSFANAQKKLKEHYDIDVPIDMIRKITEYHAGEIKEMEEQHRFYEKGTPKKIVIGETDGSMIPLVEINQKKLKKKKDQRKCRELKYSEAILSLAFPFGSRDRRYAVTLEGVEKAGQQLKRCVERIGMDGHTQIHCVGDGAPWIVNQVEEQFGAQGNYLVDFYHMCDYLSAAAQSCFPDDTQGWMEQQKMRLKENRVKEVLTVLKPYVEARDQKADTPVRDCYRYLYNRQEQVDYKAAIENDLPIGSGEIESAHRYVIQKRLKVAGAWWKTSNAAKMLALRVCRANEDWDKYWKMNTSYSVHV